MTDCGTKKNQCPLHIKLEAKPGEMKGAFLHFCEPSGSSFLLCSNIQNILGAVISQNKPCTSHCPLSLGLSWVS